MKSFEYNIPEELVEEILVRLPVKSLVRFRSVCKYWNSLITDHKFIKNHLQLNQHKRTKTKSSEISLVVLVWTQLELIAPNFLNEDCPNIELEQRLLRVTVKSCTTNDNVVPCDFEPIYLPLLPKESFLIPLNDSHCNGILYFVDRSPYFSERVIFYNPVLREQKIIQTRADYSNAYSFCAGGFGYDQKSNDYKFVRILTPDNNLDKTMVTKAEVYILGTDSWREAIELNSRVIVSNSGAHHKGFYYWASGSQETILSFDMSEEKFGSLNIPKEVRDVKLEHEKWLSLSVWNDSLVLFFNRTVGWHSKYFEMWVMGDNNNNNNNNNNNSNSNSNSSDVVWTKHVMIEPFGCVYRPVIFWRNDELLMEARNGRMVSYNLYTKKSTKFPIHGVVMPGVTYASLYVESLVSVKTRSNTLD